MKTATLLLVLLMCSACLAAVAQKKPTTIDKAALAQEVRAEFLHCWNAYKKYAWGHDGVKPLSRTYYDWYSAPFYMTAVDALDTMILMGLKEEADSVRSYVVANLSFDKDVFVKNFEFTIRLLGGLLSSYQLTGDKRLLDLAEDLGTRLLPAFKSPTGMPYVNVNLKTGAVQGTNSNPGEIGTLLVEFGTLSKLTKNPVYYDAAKQAFMQVYKSRSQIDLVGEGIDVETGKWTKTDSHLSACIDSYYEYMVKCAILFDDQDFRTMWNTSIKAINTYLGDSTKSGFWYGHADMNTGKRTKTWFGALDAFFPAVLVLAGDIPRARSLQESCMKMWDVCGVEPEDFDYGTMTAARARFFLNPEIMESTYYLYQATGDPHFLEMGKHLLDSLRTYCRVPEGYAELRSVITKEKSDRMESYFLAETLKYLYLLFAPSETLPFKEVIFNTEAHPLRRAWK